MGLKRIYRPGFAYQKAGVMLMDSHGEDQAQRVLFAVSAAARPLLMNVIDRANARWGRGTLKLSAESVRKPWKMKRERVSPSYTTCWDELPRVN